ncbi:HAD family hydrolase [Pseudomonas sp. SBB6]|uniref:HAD family hydrolase n=1 Tax=Pseudomonas sp. SBB6 TaxID=2962032 RepID=UPI0020B63F86|nr:HAD-IB family hydrolase [Pseudomonas sp. SBB6]
MQAKTLEKPVVAIFDFDRTLTDRHTFWRFLQRLVGTPRFILVAISLIPTALLLALKVIPLMAAREVMIRRCMTGVSAEKYRALGQVFARQDIDAWVKPQALARLKWHQAQGHRCLLISNSADVYLEPWGQAAGFDGISGSRFKEHDGVLTGELDGPHCQAEEKVIRVRQILGNPNDYVIHAYGDSDGDRNLLDIAQYPYYRSFEHCTQ